MLVSGSFLSETIKPKDAIGLYDKTSLDYIHVDVMDGKFVSEKTFTMSEITKFSSYTKKPLDVHLMVSNPIKYIDDLSMLNTKYITFHYEAVKKPLEVIEKIKNNGLLAGISINPETNVKEILDYLPNVDLVLIMSVKPGKSGQSFMDSVLYKIEALRKYIDENNYKTIISVDGGIDDKSFPKVKFSGVDMVVSASYFLSGDMEKKILNFKN